MNLEVLKVAVLEDSKLDQLVLKKMLFEIGFKKENIRLYDRLSDFRIEDEEIVLTDLNLPDSAGRDTLKAVLDLAKAKGVYVIVLSGLADEQLAQESIQMGAQDYLIKATHSSATLKKTLTFAHERNRLLKGLEEKQRELENTQQYLETILATAPSAILRFDENLIVEFQSRSLFKQRAKNSLVGRSIKDLIPPDELKQVNDHLHALFTTSETQEFKGEWQNDDGTKYRMLYKASAVGDGTYILVVSDISNIMATV